jgi:drug/metabolite transporter (DMT)-like permease
MTGACIGVLTHAWLENGLDLLNFTPEVYGYGIAMALIATVLASFLLTGGISKVGAGNAAIISSIGPISTIVLANIFLGEVISIFQIIGTAFVMLGVLMITIKKKIILKKQKVA